MKVDFLGGERWVQARPLMPSSAAKKCFQRPWEDFAAHEASMLRLATALESFVPAPVDTQGATY